MIKIDKKYLNRLLWVFALLSSPLLAIGQSSADSTVVEKNIPQFQATFTQDTIVIGDQIYLQLTVNKDVTQVIAFPEITTEATEGKIEILGAPELDTLSVDGRKISIQLRYKVTSFDAGLYNLDTIPMMYIDKNIQDTIYSDPISLYVTTYAIDTTTYVMADIKPRLDEPFTFAELLDMIMALLSSPYTYMVLLVLLILVLALIYLRRRKTISSKPKIVEPAHIIAIRKLVDIDNSKLWQNGMVKQYYTELTDVIRVYLHGRYGVNAMEMTSLEIFDALREEDITAKDFEKLKQLLILSDYVKFAKISTTEQENTDSYNQAYYFVEETKLTIIPKDNNQEKEETK